VPRLPYKPHDDAGPEEIVAPIRERRGGTLLNLDRQLLHSPPLALGWNALMGAVRTRLELPARLREIAICVVARTTGAEYEFSHHWPEYVKAGGSEALKAKLDDPVAASKDAVFTEDERLVMRYALAMTQQVKVPEPLFRDIQGRFSTTEIVELTAAIATYNMVARFLMALEVPKE